MRIIVASNRLPVTLCPDKDPLDIAERQVREAKTLIQARVAECPCQARAVARARDSHPARARA